MCVIVAEEAPCRVLTPRWQHPVQRVLLTGALPGLRGRLPDHQLCGLGLGPDP